MQAPLPMITQDELDRMSLPGPVAAHVYTNNFDLGVEVAMQFETQYPRTVVRVFSAKDPKVPEDQNVLAIDLRSADAVIETSPPEPAPFGEAGDRARVLENVLRPLTYAFDLPPSDFFAPLEMAMKETAKRVAADRPVSTGDSWTSAADANDLIRGVIHKRNAATTEVDLALMVLHGKLYRVANSYRLASI